MRTEYCGQLRLSHEGQQVTLCGWVNRRRDLGSLIFIDMRDREGIVQVFFDPDRADALKLASELRNEFCIQVTGTVRARDAKNVNAEMATGEIEVLASDLTIINRSDSLPLDSNHVNTEEARLKYRYLDLRRPEMAQRLKNACQNYQSGASFYGRPRLPRHRNTDADQSDAGRRARLPGTFSRT
ncbi:Aspartyl-tRNA synthetase [Citrobacter freundii]|uniref:aspartate--tRNA ligase n=1 Tax=Citrobacter freundii TaxID=546 RepID=A0A7G2IZS7_CITFR|nr:Aspartyl-tRNA synthetase [Citrobacter freundii]